MAAESFEDIGLLGDSPHNDIQVKFLRPVGLLSVAGYLVKLGRNTPVAALKEVLVAKIDVLPEALSLVCEGRNLEDNKTVRENGIQEPGPAAQRNRAKVEFMCVLADGVVPGAAKRAAQVAELEKRRREEKARKAAEEKARKAAEKWNRLSRQLMPADSAEGKGKHECLLAKEYDEDLASIRKELHADASKNNPLSSKKLLKALHKGWEAVSFQHRELTAVWGRTPISLFDKRQELQAVDRGVPGWAIDRVHVVQRLVDEATVLGNHVESYEKQINIAYAEEKRVGKEGLLLLLQQLDLQEQRLKAQLVPLETARDAFDKPADAPPVEPAFTTLVNERACELDIDHQASRKLVPDSIIEKTQTQKLRSTFGSLWNSARLVSRNAAKTAAEVTKDRRVAELRTSLSEVRIAAGRQMGKMRSFSDEFVEGVRGVRMAVNPTPPWRQATARPPWHEVTGRPSPWLAVDEVAREQRAIDARIHLFSERSPNVLGGAKSRWERCRRGGRRWSLC